MDPLNRSNALIDLDNDGWDANRDGIISVDAARSEEALAVGEQLSTLEEYFVHLDDGNMVKSGMRSVELGASKDTYMEYVLSPEASEEEISILNHDVREFHDDGTHLWVGSKLESQLSISKMQFPQIMNCPKVMICTTWFYSNRTS